ncbi:MAG: DNA-deoxyinosine glycosylase [Atopobiaceae bacterium]|nr:DNA-deoxyinosine glycosylase [Atopobiaceae bacterium]
MGGAQGGDGSEVVVHPLEPIFDEASRVLVLGTMPSPKSREASFYYGNPQNRFWRVLYALWGLDLDASEPQGPDYVARRAFALERGIALWDVLASCAIRGASDSSIAEAVPNDLGRVLGPAPIERVFTTGSTATRLYRRLLERRCGMPCTPLPSTSPANARMRLPDLVAAYVPLREAAGRAREA